MPSSRSFFDRQLGDQLGDKQGDRQIIIFSVGPPVGNLFVSQYVQWSILMTIRIYFVFAFMLVSMWPTWKQNQKSDENAFMKNYKSYENAFLLVTDKIAYEDKIEVKGWKCLQKKLYEGKITYMKAFSSLL